MNLLKNPEWKRKRQKKAKDIPLHAIGERNLVKKIDIKV